MAGTALTSLRKPLSRLTMFVLGAFTVFLGFSIAPVQPVLLTLKGSEREKIVQHYAFAPQYLLYRKHVIIGNSYVNNNAYRMAFKEADRKGEWDPEKSGTKGDAFSYLGFVADFLLMREYEPSLDLFVDMGRSGTGPVDHFFYFYHAFKVPNLKSIIYGNGHGGYYHLRQNRRFELLEAVLIMEKWREEYPGALPYIDKYLEIARASPVFTNVVAKRGNDWRKLIDPVSMRYKVKTERMKISVSRAQASFNTVVDDTFRSVTNVGENERRARHRHIEMMLEQDAEYYDDKRNDAPVRMRSDNVNFFDDREPGGPDTELYLLNKYFLEIVAAIAAEKNVNLIMFHPPNFAISLENYEAFFKPGYVDRAQSIIAAVNPRSFTIDRTVDHDLSVREAYFRPQCEYEGKKYVCKVGHGLTIIGTLKRARHLVDDMIGMGLLPTRRRPGVHAWAREPKLPELSLCVRPWDPVREDGKLNKCIPHKPSERNL